MIPINQENISIETLSKVIVFAAENYHVSYEDIFKKTRKQDIASSRFLAFFLLNRVYGWSTVRIASHFKMDHSSISHGIYKVNKDSGIKSIMEKYLSTYPQH